MITNYADWKGGAAYFVGYLYSEDRGNTWIANNQSVDLPVSPENAEIIEGESYPTAVGYNYSISNLSLDIWGQPCLLIRKRSDTENKVFLVSKKDDVWLKTLIIPETLKEIYTSPLAISVNNTNNIWIAVSSVPSHLYCNCQADWGHPQIRTLFKRSKDNGETFETIYRVETDSTGPIWFPSFQNQTGDSEYPSAMVTVGNSNEDFSNKVYAIRFHNQTEISPN